MCTGSRVSDGMLVTWLAIGKPSAPSITLSGAVLQDSLQGGGRPAELSQSRLADVPTATDLCLSTGGQGADRGRALTALGREPKIAALKVEMTFASATWTLREREKLWAKLVIAVINLTQI